LQRIEKIQCFTFPLLVIQILTSFALSAIPSTNLIAFVPKESLPP
jgi:hypothetical protein